MEWILLIILGICLYLLAVRALGKKRSRAKDFIEVPGDPNAVMAPDKNGDMVRVELPEGVTVDKVDAVLVGKKPEKAKVKVYHEKTDRRNSSGRTDHDMSI
jgi:ribosomal 50S subunit-recycling heat shock protein